MYLKYILLFLCSKNVFSFPIEEEIRNNIFQNYNPKIRPVINYNDNVNLSISLDIKNIENFDQVTETLFLNLWIHYEWEDNFLKWNLTQYPIKKISVDSHQVWTPDLVLYNAAQKPKQYNLREYMRLDYTGKINLIKPLTFAFTCSLDLHQFPFDSQNCYMEFGSWQFHNQYLYIFSNPANNIIQYDNYQGEWNLANIETTNQQLEYLCCPDEFWSVVRYDITLERYSKSYTIFIIMTILLTLTACIINMFNFKIYTRTYILIFIPLTIIWLAQSMSKKIPVIGYFSKMDTILIGSFIVCEICTLQSGILYNLYKNRNYFLKKNEDQNYIYNQNKLFNFNLLIKDYHFVRYFESSFEMISYLINDILKFVIITSYIIFLITIIYS
jgi:hypothetical protein